MCKQFMSCGCRQILEDLFNTAPASLSDANLACSGKRKDFGINVKFAFAYKKLCFPCSLLSYSDLGGVHVRKQWKMCTKICRENDRQQVSKAPSRLKLNLTSVCKTL